MSEIKVNSIKGVGATNAAITVNNSDGTCTANITNNLSNRNKVINGSMIVSQRNGTSAVTTLNAYNIDRWQIAASGNPGAYSFSQSTDSPDGFANSFKIDVTTADTSLGSTDVHLFRQMIEGQNIQDFAKGTSSAKKFTLSFYVKTNKTGTYIVNLTDVDNSRECSASYTVSNTNWNRYTVSFPADTTGAFDNDNAASLRVHFALLAGSSFQSGSLSTSWAANADANRYVGQVNLADNTSNEWLITGVQLEVDQTGSGKATDFEHRSIHDELNSCYRYFYAPSRTPQGSQVSNYTPFGVGSVDNGTAKCIIHRPVAMRTIPTVSQIGASNDFLAQRGGTTDGGAFAAAPTDYAGLNINWLEFSGISGLNNESVLVYKNGNNKGELGFSAEL